MIWKKGGINCRGGENACINSNQKYADLRTAWKKCGTVDRCSKIFRHENGSHYNYYLRTDDDIIDSNPRLLHMDFDSTCTVEGNIHTNTIRKSYSLQISTIVIIKLKYCLIFCKNYINSRRRDYGNSIR